MYNLAEIALARDNLATEQGIYIQSNILTVMHETNIIQQ